MQDHAESYDASSLLNDSQALRLKAETDGFLFFRKLLPENEILNLRRSVLKMIAEEGFLKDETELMDGIVDKAKTEKLSAHGGTCFTKELYQAMQSLPAFHKLAHHPNIIRMFENLFGESVLVHPRNIMRMVIPAENCHPTPPHQDHIYINGTENTWTCWIPLGDCPMAMGNLAVLKGSHKIGLLPVRPAAGAGGFESLVDDSEFEWLHFNYEAGDVICFPSHTVHKSIPSENPERMRLSLDYRYQPISEPVHSSSLLPHMNAGDWDSLYKDWPADADNIKFYWEKFDLEIDDTFCLEKHPELRQQA